MLKSNEYYLKATFQKSYYKKAIVRHEDNLIILKSYNTDVVAIDTISNSILRLWSGWSVTTSKHINDFLRQHDFKALSKKEWLELPCINNKTVYSIYSTNGFFTHKHNCLLTEDEAIEEINHMLENNNNLIVWYE